MKVVEVRNEGEFQKLRSAWNRLLAQSASDTIFLTWEWMAAWWTSYGTPGELRILLAFDASGELRGIAPLRAQSLRRYGLRFPALRFIGDGSHDSDYLDFILAPGCEREVLRAFSEHWRSKPSGETLLLLNEIPDASPNLPILRAFGQQSEMIWTEEPVDCSTVSLPDDWEDYLRTLRPRFRTKIRSVLRNLESNPSVRFGFCNGPEQLERLLPALFDLHARRWETEQLPGVFGWKAKREFYRMLSPLLLEREWLQFAWLEWRGRILAAQYGFSYGGRYFQLQEGYDPTCEHWNVGVGLRAWTIREFLRQGVREYDFLAGLARHKSDWGGRSKRSWRTVLARRNNKNLLFGHGPSVASRLRQFAKKIIPETALEAYRAWQGRGKFGQSLRRDSEPKAESSEGRRILTAAARCYVHSPASAMARPLLNRFELRMVPNGKRPKIAWSRRSQPSARILCFHRINDEGDPFFPALSVKSFEGKMRCLARRYRVVSLEELVKRISEPGSCEPVLAITLDDGYRDNYEHAFPVLQKYGLPATVFLTTGSVDSRELLWFEKLALALKKTSREFVDLELDVPSRVALRTEGERAQANNTLFELLRTRSDAERREWLEDILRQLGCCGCGAEPNRMLTWEQIRRMQSGGVEFGAHTVTHPILSRMEPQQASWEIAESKRRIEEELQTPVRYFAYPHGRAEDFCASSKTLLRSAGFKAAVTTIWGINDPSTDPMELRRSTPWEVSPAVFAFKLDWYQLTNG